MPKEYIVFLGLVSAYLMILGERNLLLNYLECILITYVAYNINREKFCVRFVKLCMFFVVASLVIYSIGVIAPDFLLKIYSTENNVLWHNSWGWPYYMRGRFLYVVRAYELDRNNSIFTEPGLWQIFLNASLFMLLFMQGMFGDIKKNTKRLWISLLVLTILTTASTTSYLAMAMIIGVFIISSKRNNRGDENKKTQKSIFRLLLAIVCVGCIALISDAFINEQNSLIYKRLIQKIFETTSDGTSGHARYSMILISLQLGLTHFFGVGEDYLSKLIISIDEGANGAILIHSFASIGFVPVLLILSFYYGRLFRKKIPFMVAILLVLIYLNTSLAQSRLLYPALIMLPIIYCDYCYKKI